MRRIHIGSVVKEWDKTGASISILTDDGIVDHSILLNVLVDGGDLAQPGAQIKLLRHVHAQGDGVLLPVKPSDMRKYVSLCIFIRIFYFS